MSEELKPAVEDGAPSAQPVASTGAESQQPKINLDEFEDFRKYKGVMTSKLNQVERERAADRQRLTQLQQQLNAKAMEGMDELERERYEKQQYAEMARAAQQEIDAMKRENDRQAVLFDISSETGCPMDMLLESDSPHDAWRIGNKYAREQTGTIVKEKVKERLDKQQRNQVDVGGGATPSAQGDLQSRWTLARSQYDVSAQMDIMAEANRAGITLQ